MNIFSSISSLFFNLIVFSLSFFLTNCVSQKSDTKDQNQATNNLQDSLRISIVQESTQKYYAKNIQAINLKNHIELLASESFEGRKVGERGQKMAGSYIQDFFIKNHLEPSVPKEGSKRYLQEFQVEKSEIKEVTITSRDDGEKYYHKTDFLANPYTYLHNENELNVVLTGYSILLNEQISGRGVALFLDTDNREEIFYSNQDWNEKTELQILLAQKMGAKSIFFILTNSDNFKYNAKRLKKSKYLNQEIYTLKTEKSIDVHFLSMQTAASLFDYTETELEKMAKQFKEKEIPSNLPYVSISIKVEKENVVSFTTENIIGFIEGSDKKEEVIIISAHYDHLGVINKDGKKTIFMGADDNASGVSSLLELAKTFALAKKDGVVPKRSILFLATTAEEMGMLGSSYYADISPVFPISNVVANLNIDMIGREYLPKTKYPNNDYISIVGSDWNSPVLHQTNELANQTFTQLNLDYRYNSKSDPEEFFYRSDQYSFAKYNVPVIFYTSPDHKDYHKASDIPEKIDFKRVEKVTKLIFHTVWQLASQEKTTRTIKKDIFQE
ncbi:M28 family metallopeptidase [Bernardetia sp.]|uniref:M28 family metallopeptidase n=1 Tax=Bernardetia sp. TaxID=1937974 RepID=UPI0025BECB49|nr:M28 family peptidase [Bernardetia sp.]